MAVEALATIAEKNAKRRAAFAVIAGTCLVASTVMVAASLSIIFTTLMMSIVGAVLLVRQPMAKGTKEKKVSAGSDGLVIDGKLRLAKPDIHRTFVGAADGARVPVYVEGTRGRAFALHLPSLEEARAFHDAFGVEQTRTLTTVEAQPPWAKHLRFLLIAMTLPGYSLVQTVRLLPWWAAWLLSLLYLVALFPVVLPQRVNVGDDGVSLRWLGRRRFIPFRKIIAVSRTPLGLTLVLDGGGLTEILLAPNEAAVPPERDLLIERISAGVGLEKTLTRVDEEALLARGSRDLDTWVRELQAIGTEDSAGYRGLAIPRERLWEIVENPAADPSAREGAAIALHASLDDSERARLGVLAQSTAAPRLRVALDAATAEPNPAKLRVALDAAEREEAETLSESMPIARAAKRVVP